jgi:hypothetical protein
MCDVRGQGTGDRETGPIHCAGAGQRAKGAKRQGGRQRASASIDTIHQHYLLCPRRCAAARARRGSCGRGLRFAWAVAHGISDDHTWAQFEAAVLSF